MTAFDGLFPPEVAVAHGTIDELAGPVFAEEAALVADAVPKRRREFAAGRACARRALAAIGRAPEPLLMRRDYSPRWPDGVIGSISHTDGYCAAAVVPRGRLRGIGIDLEPDAPIEPDVWHLVFTERERAELSSLAARAAERDARLLFSAKEAAYKAQHGVFGRWVAFCDVELELDEAAEEFTPRFVRAHADPGTAALAITGRFRRAHGLVVTTAWAWSAA